MTTEGEAKPKFNLEEGKGTPLGELPCFSTVPTRGKAAVALESALEPLYRLTYGRPGKQGERRDGLESFRGFPAAMAAQVLEKVKNLTKEKLRTQVLTFGMSALISQPQEKLAEDVARFFMHPKDEGRIKLAAAKTKKKKGAKRSRTSSKKKTSDSTEDVADGGEGEKAAKKMKKEKKEKKAKKEKSSKNAEEHDPSGPSDDAVRVEVYRRVLDLRPEERVTLGVKGLRTELERHFKLEEGALKNRRDIIAETASSCVRALVEAESRARLVPDSPPPRVAEIPLPSSVEAPGPSPTVEKKEDSPAKSASPSS